MEQRYAAVCEVINDGETVTAVARRFGVTRQTVHRWLRQYGAKGLAGLVDRSGWCVWLFVREAEAGGPASVDDEF